MQVSILVPLGGQFDPLSLTEGHVGGSEEAVIHLSRALADADCRVTVYCDPPKRDGMRVRAWKGTLWRPLVEFDAGGDHENLLVWRSPQIAAQIAPGQSYRVFNWLHDTHYSSAAATYEAVESIVVSKAHERILRGAEAGAAARIHVAQNGIALADFPALTSESEDRDSHQVIYASSPDRGLVHLLGMWTKVKAAVPEAKLDIYYSWTTYRRRIAWDVEFRKIHAPMLGQLERLLSELGESGVTYRGGVSHPVLHRAYRAASVWAYPTDFYEVSCISAMKAQAAGCWPIATSFGALPETVKRGSFPTAEIGTQESLETFAAELIRALVDRPSFDVRREMSDRAREEFSWSRAAEKFISIFQTPRP